MRSNATAGLIITEGTSPSPNGLGYARVPGIYFAEQSRAGSASPRRFVRWEREFFMAVHAVGALASAHLPKGAHLDSVAIAAAGEMYTRCFRHAGPMPLRKTMTEAGHQSTIEEFRAGGDRTPSPAGFDGVDSTARRLSSRAILPARLNQRTDRYGGSIENRARFVLEVARA